MRAFKKILKKIVCLFFAFLTFVLPFFNFIEVNAATAVVLLDKSYVRSTPSTSLSANNKLGTLRMGTVIDVIETVNTIDDSTGCEAGTWYKFLYNGVVAYSCTENFDVTNKYGRPWTTPKKAIVGGAIFKAENYIQKGQFTSYLVKFNVNPNASYATYTHQYMTNVRAPYYEAGTSYGTYLDNNLLNQPLVFSIPIFNNMPEYTTLPEQDSDTSGITAEELNEPAFETTLNDQGFDETYKRKLRVLHRAYPNWVFESVKTGLDWNTSVAAEQPNSYVDGDNVSLRETYADALSDAGGDTRVCKNTTGPYCLKESSNWYLANTQTTAYYMDPRNFINVERILMFEKLAYSSVYTEAVIQSRLNSTFMEGISALDNQTYASIFVEAGKTANISAVYLTSQCLQEVGITGSTSTTGAQFTYNNVTYEGLYNFFNVGAIDADSPAKSGLVWANGGATSTIVNDTPSPVIPVNTENTYLSLLGFYKVNSYLAGISLDQTASSITNKVTDATVNITDANGANISGDAKLATGSKIVIKDANNTYTNTVVIYGDLSGDGEINAIDLLYMRKHLLGTYNLTGANLQAAKIAKGSDVGAADLLYLRKYLLDNQAYKITQ